MCANLYQLVSCHYNIKNVALRCPQVSQLLTGRSLGQESDLAAYGEARMDVTSPNSVTKFSGDVKSKKDFPEFCNQTGPSSPNTNFNGRRKLKVIDIFQLWQCKIRKSYFTLRKFCGRPFRVAASTVVPHIQVRGDRRQPDLCFGGASETAERVSATEADVQFFLG